MTHELRTQRSTGDPVDDLLGSAVLDHGPGPALPLSDQRARELVRHAMVRSASRQPGKVLRFPKVPLIGVGLIVATSAAAAAFGGKVPKLLRLVTTEEPASAPAVISARSSDNRASVRSAHREAAAVEAAVIDTNPVSAASPPAELPLASATRSVERALPSDEPAPARVAADLLGDASQLRRERRFAEALRIYMQIVNDYPTTRQAQIARVSAGELELVEFHDAEAASALFQQASEDVHIGAEAWFGLAEAHRARGNMVEEKRALTELARRYPASPLAPAVNRRLAQLNDRP